MDPEGEQHGEEDDQSQEKVDQVGQNDRERQHLPWEVHLLDQMSIAHDAINGAQDGSIEIVPGQEGTEDKNGKFGNDVVGHQDSEEDRVDGHHQQGVAQAPDKAQDRVAVAQLNVPDHQVPHQLAIFNQFQNSLSHLLSYLIGWQTTAWQGTLASGYTPLTAALATALSSMSPVF